MQVKNNTEAMFGFMVQTNIGKKVERLVEGIGKVKEIAKPVYTHVNIPPMVTVELDDKIWLSALQAKTSVREQDKQVEEILSKPKMGDKVLTRTYFEPTGKIKTISILQKMVDKGELIVVEAVALTEVATTEMVKALADGFGIVVTKESHTKEQLEELYNKLCR